MKDNYDKCLAWVLVHEGGYVDHPKDPGSVTNRGVTIFRWAEYKGVKLTMNGKLPVRNDTFNRLAAQLKVISEQEVHEIYKRFYWDVMRCDDLPSGVDYAVFDFGVNSGPARSAKYLQGIANVVADGKIGPVTIKAVSGAPKPYIINELCKRRLAFLRDLSTFPTFGRGWTRRVQEVNSKALGMN